MVSFSIEGDEDLENSSFNNVCNCIDESSAKQSPSYLSSIVQQMIRQLLQIFTTNLVQDQTLLNHYRRFCHWRSYQYHEPVHVHSASLQMHEDQSIFYHNGGIAFVKLAKLCILSISYIVLFHQCARMTDVETDQNYSLSDFFQYDFPSVLQDLVFFFFVGRLYHSHSSAVDVLYPWGLFVLLGSLYPSIIQDVEFLRHSLSMYDMMCNWPVVLFVYVAILLVLAISLVVAHFHSHYQRGIIGYRLVEVVILFSVFILPYLTNNNFHLHHWYGMWLIGMLANAPEWWSKCLQAYCLGSYINGIAVYGRDPILGCKYAFYRSTNLNCPFMECYKDSSGLQNQTEHYQHFAEPDWRICNAGSVVP